jgi:phospholipase C
MALGDIDSFVIVILENRSFDHALGYLSTAAADPPMPDVEGLKDDPAWRGQWVNLYQGNPYPLLQLDAAAQTVDDPPHEQKTIAVQINTPPYPGSPNLMGGFVDSYMMRNPAPADRRLVMGCYGKDAVPVFDFFARNFVVCDHWFAALPTGTQANRLMAMGGASSIVDNAPVFLPEQDLVYDWLTAHRVSWSAYQWGDFLPFFTLMPKWLPEIATSLTLSAVGGRSRFNRYSRFRQHWTANEAMPQVIFVEPEYTDGPHIDPNDDHPPTGIAKGQAFLADLYNVLVSNPDRWRKTMMIVTYDEHGGFFDHVPPLAIPTDVAGFPFKTTGVRVPGFIVSPQVPAGRVFKGNLDHTSILQLLADRFNPGGDYSAAVGARQPKLARLSETLLAQPPAVVRTPAAPVPPPAAPPPAAPAIGAPGAAPGAAANAQAFHNAAVKVAEEHPDLLRSAGWSALTQYIDSVNMNPNGP